MKWHKHAPAYVLRPSSEFSAGLHLAWAVTGGRTRYWGNAFRHQNVDVISADTRRLVGGRLGLESVSPVALYPRFVSDSLLTTSNGIGTGDFTLAFVGFLRTGLGSQVGISQRFSYPTGQAGIWINTNATGSGADGALTFLTYEAAGTSASVAGGVDNDYHFVAGTRSGTSHVLWKDQASVATATGTARDISSAGTQSLTVGGNRNGASTFGNRFADGLLLAAAWNRALSAAELTVLGLDPWRMFERPRERGYWFGVGSTAYNLVVQDATHAHLADSLGLTQANILAIADALHAHAADGVTLSQAATLAVADALHAHSAESVALVQQHVLAVADALHSHLADSPALVQAHTLAVASTEHAHAADSPTLSQSLTLAVSDALHAHAADAVALVQAHLLAIADALHGHTVDAPGLLQANTLAVADALHGHSAESVALTQAITLAVLDALHSHLADGVSLSQAATLAVQDTLHAHTAENLDLSGAAVLAVADALHGHAADNVALTQAHVLAVADALHAHGVDAVALTQQNTLAVQDALHGHTAESPAVTEQTLLAVQDAVHAHLADSFGLTQAHVLIVNSATHLHEADGALNLVQAGTLIVSDALHSHIADLITLRMPGLGTATVFVVPHERSVFLIARETRIFPVRN